MRFFYILLFLLVSTSSSLAQVRPTPTISGNFTDLTVAQFIEELESATSYQFYIDIKQFDSIKINLSVKEQSLPQVLQLAFKDHSDIHFAIDQENNVYLTRGVTIQTSFQENIFSNKQPTGNSSISGDSSFINFLTKKKKEPVETSLENKLHEIGLKTKEIGRGNAVLTGYVRNSKTGEGIANAVISSVKLQLTTTTDSNGYYSLNAPKGYHLLNVQGIQMQDAKVRVMMYSDGTLDMGLAEKETSLQEVVVSAQRLVNINRVQLGVERLNIKTIKQVPTVFGEADVLRVVLSLPGVKTVGEASTGFNVRGGSADQNLILFNDATIYNPSHFFGLFSAFNPDVVKDIELYKSSIPAEYGGRLSSVLDISSREGNKKEYAGTAGIGLLTSRFALEGPLKKDKTSFIIGGRTTYANWLLKLLPDSYKNSKAAFYDINVGISHQINSKNNLNFTGYISNDRFNLNNDTVYNYSNRNVSVKWGHSFNKKLNSVFTAGMDQYQFNISSNHNPVNAYKLSFDINQLNFKTDFTYLLNAKHSFDFGLSSVHYNLHPGTYEPIGKESLVSLDQMPAEQALESALYISDRYNISDKLSLHAGLRLSAFNYLGPQNVNVYAAGLPKDETNLLETKTYNKGDFIKTYAGPEYRFSARYAFSKTFSIKTGYNSIWQYIHMLSNTTAIAPTDVWKLSDPNIKPQYGQQVSLGFYKNLRSHTIETSVEIYYKKIKDYLDYKPGASLVLNHHIETDVINTRGKAYGIEMMIKKQTGKLNGWVSYTYSRVLLKMDDPTVGTPVNKGQYYPANYDKPHDVTFIGNFKINHRFSFSLNATYNTGRPITLPIGRYYYGGAQRVLYSDRNAYRVPDYFRTDFSMNLEGNHKVHQKTHNSWTLGVYNLTGRKNAYSIYFVSENNMINGYKMSIFGSAIPFINYNIRF